MNKFIIASAMILATVPAMAQDVKLSDVPNTVSIKVTAQRTQEQDWRAGIAFPILNFKNGRVEGNPSIATLDFWAMSDTRSFRRMYLGGGLDFTVWSSKNLRLGLGGGWSADMSDLQQIKDGQWSFGANFTIKF